MMFSLSGRKVESGQQNTRDLHTGMIQLPPLDVINFAKLRRLADTVRYSYHNSRNKEGAKLLRRAIWSAISITSDPELSHGVGVLFTVG